MKSIGIFKSPDYKSICEVMLLGAKHDLVVSALLPYDAICEMLRYIFGYTSLNIGLIDMQNENIEGYDKEFYLTIFPDMDFDICPAYNYGLGDYLYNEQDLLFVDGDVPSSVLKKYEDIDCFEIQIRPGEVELFIDNVIDNEEDISEEYGDEMSDDFCGDCCGDCCTCSKTCDPDDDAYTDKVFQNLLNLKMILDDLFD